jgi:hypothetical protein
VRTGGDTITGNGRNPLRKSVAGPKLKEDRTTAGIPREEGTSKPLPAIHAASGLRPRLRLICIAIPFYHPIPYLIIPPRYCLLGVEGVRVWVLVLI